MMNNLDRLREMVGPDGAFLKLMDLLMKERGSKEEGRLRILFFDLDNVVFRTNQILTEKWLPKTFWRRYIYDSVQTVDMDEFFFRPEEIGIPKKMTSLFRGHILMSVFRLTHEMRKMKEHDEEITGEGVVDAIREIREAGTEIVFLTNRPQKMWKETEKQLEVVLGKDSRNIILHMYHGFTKADALYELAYFSVGLVDDKIFNLTGLMFIDKLAILFTDGKDDDKKYEASIHKAKNGKEISQVLRDCEMRYANTFEGPILITTN